MQARAQGLLPQTGTTTNVGDLRQQLQSLYAEPATAEPAAPAWQIIPSLGIQQEWTDNDLSQSGKRKDAFITELDPSLLVNVETSRLEGTLNWSPRIVVYDNDSSQSRFENNFAANAHLTLVPEHLFVNLQGYGTARPTSGGTGPNGAGVLSRQNTTQEYDFSITPYLRNRFGEWGTGEIGASASYSSQEGLSSPSTPFAGASGLSQWMSSTEEYASFISGPALGRSLVIANVSATQMDGSGAARGAYRNIGTVDYGYAITRSITPIVTLGYQTLRYGTVPPYRVDDVVWKVGLRWTPKPDSIVTLRYGHQDGRNFWSFDGSYAVTARLRLYGRYSEGLATSLQELANAVQNSTLDPLGNPIDPTTKAPLTLSSSFFGVGSNNVLYWTKQGSLTATLLYDRDAVSLGISYMSRQPVAIAAPPQFIDLSATDGTYGSVSWNHSLSPELSMNVYFQYGRTHSSFEVNRGDSDSVAGTLSLNYLFSSTLTGVVEYSYSNWSALGPNSSQNLVLVGVRKDF